MSEELAPGDDGPRCLISPVGCPTPRERDLANHALAMDSALRCVRLLAEAHAGDGHVPAAEILRCLDHPYRFPLPGDAEALAAYRKVYGHGDRAIMHLAECGHCEPSGYGIDVCDGYEGPARADAEEALRTRGPSGRSLAEREASLRASGIDEGTIWMMRP